ncbi:MAG: retropepsin-like aspartic protease [Cyanobacteria bacterium J06632_22]
MTLIKGWILLLLVLGGCSGISESEDVPATVDSLEAASTAAAPSPPVETAAPTETDLTAEYESQYDAALKLADSTAKLVQQAQSSDDWSLIVSRWQRTISQLQAIPAEAPNHATAQNKISEYERNLAYAEQQLNQLNNPPAPIPLARVSAPAPARQTTPPDSPTASADRFTIPIMSRSGGTPVILVTFNGGTSAPMILDTGASSTLITQSVANQLGLSPTGQIRAATASDRAVTLSTTQVSSLNVGSITRRNVTVAIGDAVPIGLLGNDFHQGYDISIRANTVEFIRR